MKTFEAYEKPESRIRKIMTHPALFIALLIIVFAGIGIGLRPDSREWVIEQYDAVCGYTHVDTLEVVTCIDDFCRFRTDAGLNTNFRVPTTLIQGDRLEIVQGVTGREYVLYPRGFRRGLYDF